MSGSYGWNIASSGQLLASESQDYAETSQTELTNATPAVRGHFWCPSTSDIPPGAIKAGVDKDGGAVYVGRAFHLGEMIPAKILANQNTAYVPWGGQEHNKAEFEVLCRGTSTVIWQETSGATIPPGAVPAGVAGDGERLYIGRVFHDGTLTPGKVQPSHGVLYIPYGGEEISFPTYEILILQ